MRSRVAAVLALAIGIATLCVPLFAHHGTAAFENDKKARAFGLDIDF